MIAPEDVIAWLKLTDTAPTDPTLIRVVGSINSYVSGLPIVDRLSLPTPETDWPDAINLGAIMLAARYLRRRNSPNGVEAINDAGASYVARHDSDIARLLELDDQRTPQIG